MWKGKSAIATLEFGGLLPRNDRLKVKNTRSPLAYKDGTSACIEPPGACCLTPAMTRDAFSCIRDFYGERGMCVHFSQDGLTFTLE